MGLKRLPIEDATVGLWLSGTKCTHQGSWSKYVNTRNHKGLFLSGKSILQKLCKQREDGRSFPSKVKADGPVAGAAGRKLVSSISSTTANPPTPSTSPLLVPDSSLSFPKAKYGDPNEEQIVAIHKVSVKQMLPVVGLIDRCDTGGRYRRLIEHAMARMKEILADCKDGVEPCKSRSGKSEKEKDVHTRPDKKKGTPLEKPTVTIGDASTVTRPESRDSH